MPAFETFLAAKAAGYLVLFTWGWFYWFCKVLEDVRCEATRSCYSCAGWRGLVQEKKGDFTVHHLWAGVCKKTFYSLLQHKGHSQCMRHMGRGSLE